MTFNKIFLDVETSGLSIYKHSLLQVAYRIEANNAALTKNIRIKADPKKCDPKALAVNKLDPQIGQSSADAFQNFITDLDYYRNNGKYYFIGYNCHHFDSRFIRKWFVENNYVYNKYFYTPSIDIMLICAGFCIGQRDKLGDFKQSTVARSLGIEVDSEKLHDATYDIKITKKIYEKLEEKLI